MTTALAKIDKAEQLTKDIVELYPSLFPGGANLTLAEARALAIVGTSQALDPLNKEIYYLKRQDKKTGETVSVGVMPGIRGLRKHARRQIRFEGGNSANYWIEFTNIMDAEVKAKYGAGQHDLLTIATLRDSVTMRQYLEMRRLVFGSDRSMIELLKISREENGVQQALMSAIENTADQILGKPPIVIGVGIIKEVELKKDGQAIARPLQTWSGQNAYYMAEIRAERRALYKRFDLEKQYGAAIDEVDEIDAEIMENEGGADGGPDLGSLSAHEGQPKKTEAQLQRELGF